jgi:SAM-dependent methyltransferase
VSDWNGVGAAYAASYADLCAGANVTILRMLGSSAQRTLLDIGSGTGQLAADLAREGWRVTGCEPEPTMREISRAEHPDIPVADDGLPSLGFVDGAFDCVTANFVLNHVSDPRRSAAEMRRVTAAGGVVLATTWTASPSWFWSTVRERAELRPAVSVHLSPERDFERTTTGFKRMLVESGWHTVEADEIHWTWHVSAQTLWASVAGGVAGTGSFFLSLSVRDRGRFQQAFDELCAERTVDGTIALEHSAAVATGHVGR